MDLKVGLFLLYFHNFFISTYSTINKESSAGTMNISEFVEFGNDIFTYMTAESPTNYTYFDTVRLINEKIRVCDKYVIPKLTMEKPLLVGVEFSLIAFRDFDEVHEKFSVLGSLNIVWKDELMAWNESQYNGLRTIIVPDRIGWMPTLTLVNAYEEFKVMGEESHWPVRYSSTGWAYFFPGSVFTSTCLADVTYYPWDRQVCRLVFSIYGYSIHEVRLVSLSPKVILTYFTGHGEWDVINTDVKTSHGDLVIMFEFDIKRKPMFAVINIIVPIIILSILNNFVFLIPADSGERISYCITVFLAQVVFLTLVGENMPKSAQPIALLSFYILSLLSLSVFAMACTVANMKIYYRSEHKPISKLWIYLVKLCRKRNSSCFKYGGECSQNVYPNEKDNGLYYGRYEHNMRELPEDDQKDADEDQRKLCSSGDKFYSCWNARGDECAGVQEEITWCDVSHALDLVLIIVTFVLLALLTIIYFALVIIQ